VVAPDRWCPRGRPRSHELPVAAWPDVPAGGDRRGRSNLGRHLAPRAVRRDRPLCGRVCGDRRRWVRMGLSALLRCHDRSGVGVRTSQRAGRQAGSWSAHPLHGLARAYRHRGVAAVDGRRCDGPVANKPEPDGDGARHRGVRRNSGCAGCTWAQWRHALCTIRGQIQIARPIEEVFDFVADETNEPGYNQDMVRCERSRRDRSVWGPDTKRS
jgi:hypothetical protein